MARGIFSKIHYIFDQGDLDDNWDTGGLRPLRGRTRDSGFASEGVFAALKGMVTSCDPAGVRNASSGYRTACAVPLLWWVLPDGLRRAAFVVEVTGRLEMRGTDGDRKR